MATFFGEVLSVYSRAVEEDEDDLSENEEDEQIRRELEEKRVVHLHWNPEVSECLKSGDKLQCSDFILAVGHNAARFLSVHALASSHWDVVGHSLLWNERNDSTTAKTAVESACVFHRQKDNPSVWICQVTCYIAEDQLFQWIEKQRFPWAVRMPIAGAAEYHHGTSSCRRKSPSGRQLEHLPTGSAKVLAERNQVVLPVGAWVEVEQDFLENPSALALLTEEAHAAKRRENEENLQRFQQKVRRRVAERAHCTRRNHAPPREAMRQVRLRLAACGLSPGEETESQLPGEDWNSRHPPGHMLRDSRTHPNPHLSHFLMHRRLCMNVERRQVREKQQHRKHIQKTARFTEALKAQLKERLSQGKVELPPLCFCASSFWDTHPETCANNCFFHNNPTGKDSPATHTHTHTRGEKHPC
ncbi:unnamed protein product [Tetraodon nigroviridis]|uniref:(spotted green pufferfish) hypothetical protein n=1 Tax=Tetraodon nigroviridis TaxID=99883 RepID=Q4SPW0_TETNG|nr:unnamed protein product [Tetraodon nigroviridis]